MNWIELKALHELYDHKAVSLNQTLERSSEINFLISSLHLLGKTNKHLLALDGYDRLYEFKYMSKYLAYEKFLIDNHLLKPQTRFDEVDIAILINLKSLMINGELDNLRQQIIDSNESLRGVSLMFFKNEKYLLNKPSLVDALKSILQVEQFANEKDHQYIYKLECHNPKLIVLCENLDFLTKPEKHRTQGIELWYAGGKNIPKLNFSDTRNLPIYYSCDWDYDGLLIFSWVKEIIPSINLLYPNGDPRSIDGTEHASEWRDRADLNKLSGLPPDLYSDRDKTLIKTLISEDKWIIEESNDIITMLATI